jgi:soluble lytic murein transglycosylase
VCTAGAQVLSQVEQSLSERRHALRSAPDPLANVVSELSFLQLWDEASLWSERATPRPDSQTAAQLAYVAGRYHRSIAHANRLPKSESSTLALLYPAGFRQTICASAGSYRVDPLWLHAIIWQESKYNPKALSAASARGLMQFIPDTANQVSAAVGIPLSSLDHLYDPEVSIRLGAHYWNSLLEELKSPEMALAAYNGGIDNVRRWKSKWPDGDDEFFVADIGFVETKTYVMAVYAARAAYGSLK